MQRDVHLLRYKNECMRTGRRGFESGDPFPHPEDIVATPNGLKIVGPQSWEQFRDCCQVKTWLDGVMAEYRYDLDHSDDLEPEQLEERRVATAAEAEYLNNALPPRLRRTVVDVENVWIRDRALKPPEKRKSVRRKRGAKI